MSFHLGEENEQGMNEMNLIPLIDIMLVRKKLSHEGLRYDKETFLKKVHEKKSGWQTDVSALVAGQLISFSEAEEEIKRHFSNPGNHLS